MTAAVSIPKNPVKVRAGQIGARVRWGETPRVVRMDSLDPAVKDAVNALLRLDQARRERGTGQETPA